MIFITEYAIVERIQTGRIVMFELPYDGNGIVATQSSWRTSLQCLRPLL